MQINQTFQSHQITTKEITALKNPVDSVYNDVATVTTDLLKTYVHTKS